MLLSYQPFIALFKIESKTLLCVDAVPYFVFDHFGLRSCGLNYMKSIKVQDAIGLTLSHDITEITPDKFKGVAFKRGHVVREEDVEHLLRIGKEHLYVWENNENLVHEDDAAYHIAKSTAGQNIEFSEPKEGRINIIAKEQGLLKVNVPLLHKLNSIPDVAIATAHTMQEVAKGKVIGGTRVIPLAVRKELLSSVTECCQNTESLFSVMPFKSFKVAIIVTGSEVYHGRIEDGFTPVLKKKFAAWNCPIHFTKIVSDETDQATQAIEEAIASGADFIALTGGMSVDPDDKTPAAISKNATEVISYGAPIFPGAMFMLAYKGSIPMVGLPGCVMYHRASVFDIVMPRILAGIRMTKHDILTLAHGGLCESCPVCHYPNCSFGKSA